MKTEEAVIPDIVKRSVECNFLLLAVGPPAFRAVIEQIGFASSFQETHGYYADAVGLATVVLPTGWQERLVPLADEAGNLRAYCLEVHDTSVSKLIAGREKDFAFIKELLDRGLVDLETFIARAELVADMPQRDAQVWFSDNATGQVIERNAKKTEPVPDPALAAIARLIEAGNDDEALTRLRDVVRSQPMNPGRTCSPEEFTGSGMTGCRRPLTSRALWRLTRPTGRRFRSGASLKRPSNSTAWRLARLGSGQRSHEYR